MRNLLIASGCFLLMAAVCLGDESSKAELGKPAPDFSVTGIDGKQLKLSELTSKGNNVVLLFDRAHW